jgi:hypothetical protein
MKKALIFLVIAGGIFVSRYLFLITVIAEERTLGGFYEPLRVMDIKIDAYGKPIPLYMEEFFIKKKIGGIEFIINPFPIQRDAYPKVKMRWKKKEYVLLFASYVGPLLQVYISRAYMNIFGKSIYLLRTMLIIFFLSFLLLYIKFTEKFFKDATLYISAFLITFPLFVMEFFSTCSMGHVFIFILEILLTIRVKRILAESSLNSSDLFLILLAFGFILHLHFVIGIMLLLSMVTATFLSSKNISFKVNFVSIFTGGLLFTILISPFFLGSPVELVKNFVSRAPLYKVMLLPLNTVFQYIRGIFVFPSFFNLILGKEFGTEYLIFSIPSGFIIVSGFLGIILKRRDGKFEKFLFLTFLFYFILTLFVPILLRHINYMLPFIFLFIPYGLKRILGLSEKSIKAIFLIGIFLNICQLEMLRKNIIKSSLSLPLHKEVADYLIKNRINRINNFGGRYDYIFISDKKIEVRDFAPFFFGKGISAKTIGEALLLSKGEVILLEAFRRRGYTTGISLEVVNHIAKEMGMNVEVLKKFPEEGKYELALVKVE